MTHDIKSGEGNFTVSVPFIYAVGPIGHRISPETKDKVFPDAIEVWAFSFWCAAGQMSVFFPDDQAGALMERARLVEAMNKIRSMADATNAVEVMKAEINAIKGET